MMVGAFEDAVFALDKGRISFCGEPSELDADALARAYLGDGPDAAVATTQELR